jgi:DNA mismatch repair protein MutL
MSDVITLLPDHIANQIAAGEVIQRPASAVKELLENAVDAGATEIQLFLTDAGKRLIQVIDNGKGMSETDARMCFERHATSKIKQIDDLFHIRTMGFRGEALASIAAVARVELKTKRAEDNLGVYIEIENSQVLKQEACHCAVGTNISMKNLFFNVPARRNFLKSNNSELRHVIDEFIRVSLANPKILFTCTHNGVTSFHLEPGSHKQRFLQLLGNQYNAKLIPVKEQTDYLDIYGFVGKPDSARKTKSEQYFFVNDRYIKSPYLSHAVSAAFENLIPKDSHPIYALYFELDSCHIDINVHPTKQEIKFDDERLIYSFTRAAVKHALAQYSVAPPMDFSLNATVQQSEAINQPITEITREAIKESHLYQSFTQKNVAHKLDTVRTGSLTDWKDFFNPSTPHLSVHQGETSQIAQQLYTRSDGQSLDPDAIFLQVQKTYIVAPFKTGYIIVHQQHAHERILYEKYAALAVQQKSGTQAQLFPIKLEFGAVDAALMNDLIPDLEGIGYKIESFGGNSFILHGVPADVPTGNEKDNVELLLEQYKHFSTDLNFAPREKLLRCLARQQAVKAGQKLSQKEMRQLVSDLFACNTPFSSPSGLPAFVEFDEEKLFQLFGN